MPLPGTRFNGHDYFSRAPERFPIDDLGGCGVLRSIMERPAPRPRATTWLDRCATMQSAGDNTPRNKLEPLFHYGNNIQSCKWVSVGSELQMAARPAGLTGEGAWQGPFLGRRIHRRADAHNGYWGTKLLQGHETWQPRQPFDWGRDRSTARGGGCVCRLIVLPGAVYRMDLVMRSRPWAFRY